MPQTICQNAKCKQKFYSKHSVAKYCSKKCAGRGNADVHRMNSTRYTNDELIEALQLKAEELGRTPSHREMLCPNSSTYQERFGSWNNAVVKAGLKPNFPFPPSMLESDEHKIPFSLRFKILERDGFRCTYCGGTPKDGYILHVDHIKPVSKGGKTLEENLTTACWPCNNGKSNK